MSAKAQIHFFLILLLLFTAAESAASEQGSVQGIVSSATTGQPLAKVRVLLQSVQDSTVSYSASSQADGHFLIQGVAVGSYRLAFDRTGYVSAMYQRSAADRNGTVVALAAGQNLGGMNVRMIPTAALAGRVTDADGEPLAGVQVQALHREYVSDQLRLLTVSSAATNDRGEFRIWGLKNGRYLLMANYGVVSDPSGAEIVAAANKSEGASRTEPNYVRTYYPGTLELSQAGFIELSPGDDRGGTDITMVASRLFRVRGRVFNSINSRDVAGISVELKERAGLSGSTFFSSAITKDSLGSFELTGVLPGSYVLSAQWHDGRKNHYARQVVDIGNSDIENASLVITDGVSLAGQVHGLDLNNDSSKLSIDFRSREGLILPELSHVPVKPDGSFVLPDVPEGLFDLYITGLPQDAFLKAVRFRSRDVLASGLTVSRDQHAPIDIEIGHTSSDIEGTVLDDTQSPVAGAQVAVIPAGDREKRTDLYRTATADASGHYRLDNVPPGDYKLFAWLKETSGYYPDPEIISESEGKGTQVSVQDSGGYKAELTLIHPAQ